MNEHHYVVAVGIDHYPEIGKLTRAQGDARAFRDWAIAEDGGAAVHERVLEPRLPLAKRRADATPVIAEVKEQLKRWMDEVDRLHDTDPDAWERSRLYFYVAGHGMAKDSNDAALFMANAGSDEWNQRVSCSELLSLLVTRQTFREVVIFADCCRHKMDHAGEASLGFDQRKRNRESTPYARCFATVFGEAAHEPNDDNADAWRGYFTDALLAGLKGEAAPKGKPITAINLRDYVERRVPVLTGKLPHGSQRPSFLVESKQEFIFVPASPGQRAHDVAIQFSRNVGRVLLVGRDHVGRGPFTALENSRWNGLKLTQGPYFVMDADTKEQHAEFDFTGPPPEGGEHVETI